MTQKERLVELLKSVSPIIGELCNAAGTHVVPIVSNSYIADYLLANGVIVPPCKVGDTVYRLEHDCTDPTDNDCDNDCYSCKYHFINIHDVLLDGLHKVITAMEYWKKYYFPTREEAEQALKEREKGDK